MEFGMPFLLEHDGIDDAARLCHELGLAFVEINANFPPCGVDGMEAATLRDLAAEYGIFFTLHIEEECDPFALNPAVRAAWMETVRKALRLARAANMPIVNMHLPKGVYITLPTERVYLYRRYWAEYQGAVLAFRGMVEAELAGSGMRLCIENTNGWQPHEREAIGLLLASPVFGLTFDIGHSHGTGDRDENFILAHRTQLCHMHGHDALGAKNHLALGDGEIDLRARFALAKACGAGVVLETKTVAALTQSVARLPMYL